MGWAIDDFILQSNGRPRETVKEEANRIDSLLSLGVTRHHYRLQVRNLSPGRYVVAEGKRNEIAFDIDPAMTYEKAAEIFTVWFKNKLKHTQNKLISIHSDSRIVISIDDEKLADELKKEIQDSKKRINVRIFERKGGYKLYIDFQESKLTQLMIVHKAHKILKDNNAYSEQKD